MRFETTTTPPSKLVDVSMGEARPCWASASARWAQRPASSSVIGRSVKRSRLRKKAALRAALDPKPDAGGSSPLTAMSIGSKAVAPPQWPINDTMCGCFDAWRGVPFTVHFLDGVNVTVCEGPS